VLGIGWPASTPAEQDEYDHPSLLPVPQSAVWVSPAADRYPDTGRPALPYAAPQSHAPSISSAPASIRGGDVIVTAPQPAPEGATLWGIGRYCGPSLYDGCGPRWYFSAAGLILHRDRGNQVPLTYGEDYDTILMHSSSPSLDWQGGWEVRIGRWLNCKTAIEAVYWGTGQFHGSYMKTSSVYNEVNTYLNFGSLTWSDDSAIEPWFNTTDGAHMVLRTSEFHNVEVNLVRAVCGQGGFGCSPCRTLTCTWLGGIRFFKFYDNFAFGTSRDDEDLAFADDDAFYDIEMSNYLIGPQVGARFDWAVCPRVSLWLMPRVGLFGNHITQHTLLVSGEGSDLLAFEIRSHKNDVAMIGQIDLGVDWHITPRLTAFAGYRAVAAAGVALPDDQIPLTLDNAADIRNIDSSGHVILHGAVLGAEYRW
jgi:hypothetical protein